MIAKDYLEVVRVDFNATSTYVAKFTIIKAIVEIGARMDLEIHQIDVKTIFLNWEFKKNILMEQL